MKAKRDEQSSDIGEDPAAYARSPVFPSWRYRSLLTSPPPFLFHLTVINLVGRKADEIWLVGEPLTGFDWKKSPSNNCASRIRGACTTVSGGSLG